MYILPTIYPSPIAPSYAIPSFYLAFPATVPFLVCPSILPAKKEEGSHYSQTIITKDKR
jgi:hypothetical protein